MKKENGERVWRMIERGTVIREQMGEKRRAGTKN